MSTNEETWKTFFESGTYLEGWVHKIDPESASKEVDGVIKMLGINPGSHVLDWCGGYGRHSIELAKRGFQVTLLDFAENHVQIAEEAAEKFGVQIDTICCDFRSTPSDIKADFAVNLFTSGIGYLTEEDDLKALESLYGALKPGGKVLVDTMSLFWLASNYRPKDWYRYDDLLITSERVFDFFTHKNSDDLIYIEGEGVKKVSLAIRVFTPRELVSLLRRAGLEPLEIYGDFEGSAFSFESKRLILTAKKK